VRVQASTSLPTAPTWEANTAFGECGRAPHQRFAELTAGTTPKLVQLAAVERTDYVFHPDYPPQRAWGFQGNTADGPALNPTIVARYGRPLICRLRNDLPQDHTGFGTPEVSLHLHNLHTPSESDGFPGDYFSPMKAGPTMAWPGQWKDHFYPNVYAGLDEFGGIGDTREALGTLWYHDHTLDFTAPNAGRGLAGFYLIFDDVDSGDEKDTNPNALRLPSHPYDYPLLFQDKRFDANGIQIYDPMDSEGVLGDKVTVNGKIEPILRVARRKYRLRLLNGGPIRFYQFFLVNGNDVVQKFTHIANDGNLLPAPLLDRNSVKLGVAERADIVVDFSQYPIGTKLYLVNRADQTSPRGPDGTSAPGTRVLRILVNRDAPEPDTSVVKNVLRPLRPLPTQAELDSLPVRRWEFKREGGMWTINGELVNVYQPRAMMSRGSAEIWELVNPSGGWSHPVHIHFEEGRILSKTLDGLSVPIPVYERGRKDVYVLEPNSVVRVLLRFRDFTGKYVMHCHNMAHEDHAMMVRWDIA
jgi:FtsP/CotA-like multicopper oxidase with cupredoxin domain